MKLAVGATGQSFAALRRPSAALAPRRSLSQRQLQRRLAGPFNSETRSSQDGAAPASQPQAGQPPREQQQAQQQQIEEQEERDLFVPILVIVALLGYCATAAIAWWEYNF